MPGRQASSRMLSLRNRSLGIGLWVLAMLLYGAITWRWTRGF